MQSFDDLTPTQRAIVRACRNWTTGAAAWAQSDIEIRALLGPGNGTLAARFLGSFLRRIDASAVRDLAFGRRGCARLWPDERLLLDVLAECQDGGLRRARRRLGAILPPAAGITASDFAAAFGATLKTAGLALLPEVEDAETPAAARAAIAPRARPVRAGSPGGHGA